MLNVLKWKTYLVLQTVLQFMIFFFFRSKIFSRTIQSSTDRVCQLLKAAVWALSLEPKKYKQTNIQPSSLLVYFSSLSRKEFYLITKEEMANTSNMWLPNRLIKIDPQIQSAILLREEGIWRSCDVIKLVKVSLLVRLVS